MTAETNKKTSWLADHLLFLKGLKSPSEAQQLFILLAGKNGKSAKELKTFDTLVKGEKAAEKAKEARIAVSAMLSSAKKEEAVAARKSRTHDLIKLGLLFDYAGLNHLSRSEMLGLLIEGAKAPPFKIKEWSSNGAVMLTLKEPPKAPATPATEAKVTPVVTPEPASDVRSTAVALNVPYSDREAAKSLGAKWDESSKKWIAAAGLNVALFKKWLT